MKAKVKTTQQTVYVRCIDKGKDVVLNTWVDDNGNRYLSNELDFEDFTDYKAWTERLIHDLAVQAYANQAMRESERQAVVNDIVLFAYAVTDRMMQEAKTWR